MASGEQHLATVHPLPPPEIRIAKQLCVELIQLKHLGSLVGFLWAQNAHGMPGVANRCVLATYLQTASGCSDVLVDRDRVVLHHEKYQLALETPLHFRQLIALFDTGQLSIFETVSEDLGLAA